MKSAKIFFILTVCITTAYAQTETYDIVTYQPIPGWKKQVTDYAAGYSIVDNVTGSWSQLGIYKSIPGNNNASGDFSNEWKSLVKADTYVGAVEPKPTQRVEDGWTYSYGTSPFKWQGKDATIALLNISGYNLMLSIVMSGNSKKYDTEIDTFLKSIQLKKPAVENKQPAVSNNQSPASNGANDAPKTPVVVTGAPGISGITLATTNFDDGWVAKPFADYVLVTKQSTNVLLHYALQVDDEMRYAENMAVVLWNRLVANRYRTNDLRVFKNEPYTYFKVYFVEAESIDLSTNKPCYVALRVLVDNGIARPIEIVTTTAAEFQKEFSDQKKIESMMNYNKFAVSPKDLAGTWESSSSAGVNMYNSVTGAYAGMNTSSMADSFEFRGDGSYHSNHKGAYGMVGSLQFYDQKYDGKYTLTNWDVTMTNRFKGATNNFWCQYEAVRGGRVLHLVDKEHSGSRYDLVKVK